MTTACGVLAEIILHSCCAGHRVTSEITQACKLHFVVIIWSATWNGSVSILGFRQRRFLLVPGCVQRQQDGAVGALGWRQRCCASSDMIAADSTESSEWKGRKLSVWLDRCLCGASSTTQRPSSFLWNSHCAILYSMNCSALHFCCYCPFYIPVLCFQRRDFLLLLP